MKKLLLLPAVCAGITLLSSGCGENAVKRDAALDAISVANMDTAVAPGADFYQYADGGWIKNNPLKPEYARFGRFDELRDLNQSQLKSLIQDVTNAPQEEGSNGMKIGAFYTIGMDSARLNSEGASPLKDELAAIYAIEDKAGVSRMVAQLHKEGMGPFFSLYVGPDEKSSMDNLVQLYQGSLGLGDRDYYLLEDASSQKIYDAYKQYVNKIFQLSGLTDEEADKATTAVLSIENIIAKNSYSRVELRDAQKNYNKITAEEFRKSNAMLDWNAYFESMGLMELDYLDAKQLPYYKGVADMMNGTSVEDQKYYLAFCLLNGAAPYLSDDFVNANFNLYGKTLSGKEEMQPRWKRVLNTINDNMGEALGELYVEKYFPASSKEKMLKMVKDLQSALSDRINSLTWMGEETKAKAQEKLSTFIVKIGYPDKWRDYSALQIEDDSYWANVRRASAFEFDYMMSQLGKPVDRGQWFMSPQTVNAYYNPTTNEICFPAGILQPPFFDPEVDDAVNYGAIGVVIGHEMTHGFDDQGRNYDKDGNLTDWWTAEDSEEFTKLADILVRQYSDIVVSDTVHANGSLTLGENIADQGGLLVSFQAYMNTLKGKEAPQPIAGFTAEQRFFLSYAGLWAQNIRKEEILRLTKIDPHSLGKWRVNAALRNIDPFYTAFGIVEGDPMFLAPSERVNIW
jgi:putative endopeptidase